MTIRTRKKQRRLELWIVQRILLRLGNIFVIIVVFIHSWWNLNSTNNWCISVCMEKQVIWREIDITLRNFERSYHLSIDNDRIWDTEFIVHMWLNWYHDSVFIYISSSGNDIGVIFVDVHRVFDVLRVPKWEFNRLRSMFYHCYELRQAYQTIILCY